MKCGSYEPLAQWARQWLMYIVKLMMNLEEMAHYEFDIFINHGVFNKIGP